jgi:hypothetical protein
MGSRGKRRRVRNSIAWKETIMNRKTLGTFAALAAGAALATAVGGCATTSPYAAAPMKQETTGAPAGEKIREAQVQGYRLTYYLLDVGQAAGPRTEHLMVFVTAADGKDVTDAAVSYRLTGPGAQERTVLASCAKGGQFNCRVGPEQHTAKAMSMAGGYGADVEVHEKGDYKITTKVTVGDKGVADEFVYTVR